ncbi:hypothetical protein Niako_1019 [Niastella koreensis GR20-10]|uniref:Uncharacterized protein n=1 Tax=Niastella koreensis (strain DSM 17620 / KACC 11465 / NBRC 106392 / GR20-10) TaxID=700598 RepID=G8TGH5_NIAKG|nr:hypothetical protein Niako_1019 [Niastella koreensis GR20-10]
MGRGQKAKGRDAATKKLKNSITYEPNNLEQVTAYKPILNLTKANNCFSLHLP